MFWKKGFAMTLGLEGCFLVLPEGIEAESSML